MSHFVSFTDEKADEVIPSLVFNLVDSSMDAGAVAYLVSRSLETLDAGVAAQFNSDPLIDYRAQRPLMNYKSGHIVGMRREGIALARAVDVEGKSFLRLHGMEPDFHWDALLADMFDVVERYGVKKSYSFSAVAAGTPHTRPADMLVRTTDDPGDRPVLEADFWFPASFADYFEYHAEKIGVSHTNIAVRVPMYLAGNRYTSGALSALGMASSLSGLHFPIGDLEQEAHEESTTLAAMAEQNGELAQLVGALEKEYDDNGVAPGFVNAPATELSVPSMEEIGRAAEQFLAGVSLPEDSRDRPFDPQGLLQRLEGKRGGGRWRRRGKHSQTNEDQQTGGE